MPVFTHHPLPLREPMSRPMPLDQADGLRRLFAHARVCIVPVVSNPNVAFGGVMLERLCTAFAEHGKHTLVIDAAERANAHAACRCASSTPPARPTRSCTP
jgi:flagellar biosynthesis protein FlhG